MAEEVKTYNGSKTFLDIIKPREDFSTYQGNILAQCYGNLNERELDLLDYCLTFIKKSDTYEENTVYQTSMNEMFGAMGLDNSGATYKEFAKIIKNMREKTNILIPFEQNLNGKIVKGYNYVSLFQNFMFYNSDGDSRSKNGFAFSFNKSLAPYLYGLKDGSFFVLEYRQLKKVSSKYERKLLGLWKSHQYGNNKKTVVSGSLQEWRVWLLGSNIADDENEVKKWPAGKVKSNAIMRGIEKLEKSHYVTVTVEPQKKGRTVVGFMLTFIEQNSKEIMAIQELDDIINRKKVDQNKVEEYMDMIFEYALKTNQSPLAAAEDLFNDKKITFIPDRLRPKRE